MNISERSRKRLVQIAQVLATTSKQTITSLELEKLTGWSAAVIRKDISLLNLTQGASNGYNTARLSAALAQQLGVEKNINRNCCIVGLGRLGTILLENSIPSTLPFKIVAGFDSNVNRTEILRAEFPLHPTTRLEQVIQSEKIRYAILTVPDEEAPQMASQLAAYGIKGIVNYTAAILSVPDNVAVENVSLVTALIDLAAQDRE